MGDKIKIETKGSNAAIVLRQIEDEEQMKVDANNLRIFNESVKKAQENEYNK